MKNSTAPSVEEIVNGEKPFNFSSDLIKRFMRPDEHEVFVKNYVESRHTRFRTYEPSGAEVKAFEAFSSDLITRSEFGSRVGLKDNSSINYKLGTLFVWSRSKDME